ncbi:MAG TPA: ATPase, T2SS/T4P/T4SS family, partial [Polyangiaceae bacterium]|nr:ATPase, T2SS/T4P/T4SS family [Polyangiaceae bacterium]
MTVGFLDGHTQAGTLARFSPSVADLTLTLTGGQTPKATYPAERIAYIGFHRDKGDPPPSPHRRGGLKLHVSGGKTFLADPLEAEEPGAIGFYAKPADTQSPFREIFFYGHGINLRELNEPLGAMLVKDGRVGPQALSRGLDVQKEQKRTPIGQILVEHKRIDYAAMEQAAALQKRKGTRIGEVLIEAGLADAHDIEFALAEQRKRGGKRIGQILIEMSLVSEVDLSMTLAKKFQLPFVDLDRCAINLAAVEELPREFIEKHKILPVETEPKGLTVAMGDPLAVDAIDAARMHTKKQIREVVATPSQLEKYIPTYLDQLDTRKVANEMEAILKGLAADDVQAVSDAEGPETGNVKESDNSIIKLANQIIIDAYRRGASDIHIEPNGKERTTTIRFRIDGDCVSYQEIPSTYRLPLVARFKIMALLDISERRKPQDGKIRFRVGEKQIELRVATIPTVNHNEDIVLRILAASKPLPLEKMGMSDRNLTELRKVIAKPYGLVLCVGPTGSGKTTSLHSALGAINTVDMKI